MYSTVIVQKLNCNIKLKGESQYYLGYSECFICSNTKVILLKYGNVSSNVKRGFKDQHQNRLNTVERVSLRLCASILLNQDTALAYYRISAKIFCESC